MPAPVMESDWMGRAFCESLRKPCVFRGLVPSSGLHRLGADALLERFGDQRIMVANTDRGLFRGDRERGHYVPGQVTDMPFRAALQRVLRPGVPDTYIPRLDISRYQELLASLSFLEDVDGPAAQLLLPALWIGPAGNRMPLHHDFADNFFVQAVGRKRFVFLDPRHELATFRLPVRDFSGRSSWHGTEIEDVCSVGDARFPSDALLSVVLSPGDVLWLPNLWWHEVTSLDTPTISVSSWWSAHTYEAIQAAIREVTRLGESIGALPRDWRERVSRPGVPSTAAAGAP